ncbi:hypothetical protein OBBRIDRAFT_798605 [Obba rivulosa]|uniref:Uncharacterized protein n=1 Tax=Obba rivulosa TaxID=1052685 RepID=A0A8E2AQS4_9APHY|nr:hypothetical protein OBBRIDRAFT_798605 [Obba rivulosa]
MTRAICQQTVMHSSTPDSTYNSCIFKATADAALTSTLKPAMSEAIDQQLSVASVLPTSSEDSGVTPLAEKVTIYPDYESAAKAACAWVEKGKQKVDVKTLELYYGKFGSAKDRVVGVGYKPNLSLLDLVRLDMDDVPPGQAGGKGIHFNAVNLSDSSDKLAAVLKGTPEMDVKARNSLYVEYLNALSNRSAEYIWNWWKTGKTA